MIALLALVKGMLVLVGFGAFALAFWCSAFMPADSHDQAAAAVSFIALCASMGAGCLLLAWSLP